MIIMVYSRKIDPKSVEAARGHLTQWIKGRKEELPGNMYI